MNVNRRERVRNPGHEHKYWTQIPNLIHHRGLSPAAQALYGVYCELGWKNGTSAYSERELADLVGCSRHTIRGARQELIDDGWVSVDEAAPGPAGAPLVTIANNWPRNNAFFEGRGDGSTAWEARSANGSNMDHSSGGAGGGSDLDHSKADLDHSAESGRPPAGDGSNLDHSLSNLDHSELDVKTGRLEDRLDEEVEDSRVRARSGPGQARDVVASQPETLWRSALDRLSVLIPPAQFDAYLSGSRGVAFDDGRQVLQVAVPDSFHLPWLQGKLSDSISRALADVAGQPVRVDWRTT